MNGKLKTIVGTVGLLLISLWLGAAVFFSAIVAPAVFSVVRGFALPNGNEIAGTIVTRALGVVNVSGFVMGLLLLTATLIWERPSLQFRNVLGAAALAVMTIATGVGHWVIAAKMRALRVAMVTIDQVSRDDPRRAAFDDLHHYSVLALGIAIGAAIIALVLTKTRFGRQT